MTTEKAIRKIMDARGERFMDVAEKMNMPTNTFSGRLKSKNISIKKLNDILSVLRYKIVLVPENEELKTNEYEIE